MSLRPAPHETARAAADRATSPLLKALFDACAQEWSPGFATPDAPAATARAIKITPVGRALWDLINADDLTQEAYRAGAVAAAEIYQAREDYRQNNMDLSTLENTDVRLWTHRDTECTGDACTIHRRSNHHMRDWPQGWNADRSIIERYCPHGIGHPDPDETFIRAEGRTDTNGMHGCDGCCTPPANKEK